MLPVNPAPTTRQTISVLFVGEAMIELSSVGERQLTWTFAGDTLNSAAALAAALPTAEVKYLTGIGDDPISQAFLDFCSELRVDATNSPVVPGRNLGLYWISTDGGDRTFQYWRNESAARQVLGSEPQLPSPGEIAAVVFSNITLAVAGSGSGPLLRQAAASRDRGSLIGFDMNYRPALWPDVGQARAATAAATAVADVVVASADDVAAMWEETPEVFTERLEGTGVTTTVVTDGPGPIVARSRGEVLQVQPTTVDVVDSTGAGDAFFGTLLASVLAGHNLREAIERAAAIGSTVVRHPGALNYLLNR